MFFESRTFSISDARGWKMKEETYKGPLKRESSAG